MVNKPINNNSNSTKVNNHPNTLRTSSQPKFHSSERRREGSSLSMWANRRKMRSSSSGLVSRCSRSLKMRGWFSKRRMLSLMMKRTKKKMKAQRQMEETLKTV
jgi:hypothetical protein